MSFVADYIKAWLRWPIIWWLFSMFAIPLSVPAMLFYYLNNYNYELLKKRLEGKVVLITGASSGLGEALAHSFYKAGCKVILSSRRKKELERVRDILLQTYKTCPIYPPVVLPLDVSNVDEVFKVAEKALAIYGVVDVLINNAGVSYRGNVLNTKIDVDKKIMDVNYMGPVALTKAILPKMVQRKTGHIVAVCSVQGLIGLPHRSAYAASKHALRAFHDCLRAEVAEHNINITVLNPGYIKTNLSTNALTGNGQQYGIMDETTSRGQEPTEVAEILFRSVIARKKDVTVAPFSTKMAINLRHFCPWVYFWIMKKRAKSTSI